jgi:NADPH-dependent 2,4-dienoyl-CoA reductase/sulfur reductase-like enzyme
VGREGEIVPGKAPKAKKVFVIGAGPGGLEAAYTAWERGHKVSLIEGKKDLGGQLNLASLPPGRKEIERYRDFLIDRIQKTDVEVLKGKRSITSLVRKDKPDALILATGASPRAFTIPGLKKSRSMTAWEVLAGKKRPTGTCLVLGAGLVGCETADFLSEKGVKAVLVEVLPEIGTGADADTKAYFEMRFKMNGVEVYTRTELLRMEGRSAILKTGGGEIRVPAGKVVFSVGAAPNDELSHELKAPGLTLVKVGDCIKARTILDAVREGFEAGSSI